MFRVLSERLWNGLRMEISRTYCHRCAHPFSQSMVVVLKPMRVKANYSSDITCCTKSPGKLFCTSRRQPFFPLSCKLRHRVERAWPCMVLHLITSVCGPICVCMYVHVPRGKLGLSNTGGDSLSHDWACDGPYVTLQKPRCQAARTVAARALINFFYLFFVDQ